MSIAEAFRTALAALTSNKVRALLTMLGIIIGVGAVVGMLAIGNGLSQWISGEFDRLGVGVFYVAPQVDSTDPANTQRPQLTAADIEALLLPGAAPAVADAMVQYDGNGIISAGGERYFYNVHGVTPSYYTISSHTLGAGRFLNADDERSRARVALVGSKIASALLGGTNAAIGKRITVSGVPFEVVGVLTTKSGFGGGDPQEEVFLPYTTAVSRLFRNSVSSRVDISQATVKARSKAEVDAAIHQATDLIRARHRLTYQNSDFSINNPQQAAQQAQTTIVGFNAFLGTIAGISLLVGGIGIMNIMLVSVTQRTREIGLRKAVGAKRRDVLLQFLIEAVVLSLLGGALGVVLGWLMSVGGDYVLQNIFRAEGARATVTLGSVLLATGVSTAIGLVFGLFPAMRAARLLPVRALRAE